MKDRAQWTSTQSALVQLCRARDLLANFEASHASVADAASLAELSVFQFIRRFDSIFGETPHQFRTRIRITAAQRLLAQGHSVTSVCLEVGFSSLGSFSTLFTRWIGISPAAYRRTVSCSVYIPEWIPHAPNCLFWMGGTDALAIFKKTFRHASVSSTPSVS